MQIQSKNKEPWWKFKAHHWSTETIGLKILSDVWVAQNILKGNALYLHRYGAYLVLARPKENGDRGVDLHAAVKNGRSIYGFVDYKHPESLAQSPNYSSGEVRYFFASDTVDISKAVFTDRDLAIRVYEILRCRRKSLKNKKYYQKSKNI